MEVKKRKLSFKLKELAETVYWEVDGDKLREFVLNRRLSFREFSRRAGISPTTTCLLLQGKRKGSPSVFIRILAAFPDAEDIFVPRRSQRDFLLDNLSKEGLPCKSRLSASLWSTAST